MGKFLIGKNQAYWENKNSISLIDQNLKKLEIAFISRYLKRSFEVADVGCGDGATITKIASLVKSVTGIESSDYLKRVARKNIAQKNIKNAIVRDGNILTFSAARKFDAIITERVLINLPSWKLQCKAIENIYQRLKVGGLYILVENTNDGHKALNKLRKKVGLKPLPIHWHNLYFDDAIFRTFVRKKFEIVEHQGFSLYYFLSRVYMQMFASFTGSGKGAKADKIFTVADPAARMLHEAIGDQIFFKENNNILGPIQGFVLRKRAAL